MSFWWLTMLHFLPAARLADRRATGIYTGTNSKTASYILDTINNIIE